MSKPVDSLSLFVPPPVDGLNLIAAPTQLQPTEARVLNNYWVLDSGIKQIPVPSENITSTSAIGMMYPYIESATSAPRMLYATDNKIYRLDAPTDVAGTNVTGAAVVTTNNWNPCYFNKRIFLFNSADTPLIHDLGAGNVTAFSASGPTVANLVQATGYKNRLYCVEVLSTIIWYGGVDAIAGTFTALDLGAVFSTPGFIVFATTWTLNQGNGNLELFVVANSSGEILIYSGDYPDAANWQKIVSCRVPGFFSPQSAQPFVSIGGDVYLSTRRGVVALSSVVAGLFAKQPYATVSRKIKNAALARTTPVVDPDNPFAYFCNNLDSGVGDIYVLNYERGAWSRYVMGAITGSCSVTSMAIFDGHLMIGTGTPDFTMYNVDLDGQAGAALTYKWATPFFDFGNKSLVKRSNFIEVLGRNHGDASDFKNSVSISTKFADPGSAIADTKSTAVSADTDVTQELAPPGYGKRISYVFSRAGTNGANERNEIRGFEVHYTEGGNY